MLLRLELDLFQLFLVFNVASRSVDNVGFSL